jgi:two-component system response regulator RegX3
MRIGVLEDDRSEACILSQILTKAGHNPFTYDSGAALVHAFQREPFEFLLLDWSASDVNGVDVVKRIRGAFRSNVGAIVVTARDSEQDIVHALKEGADDVVLKPYRPRELVARISSLARKAAVPTTSRWNFGHLVIDTVSRQAWVNARRADLTSKDFDLAVYLLSNPGRLLSRSQILRSVWGTSELSFSRTLDTHISRVRHKLGLIPPKWQLQALYSHGYRLSPLDQHREPRGRAALTPLGRSQEPGLLGNSS